MLHLSTHLAYTHVKHCLGASTHGASANAASVSGFGVHPRKTIFTQIPMERLQMLHLSADLAYTHVKTLPWRKYQWSVCKICKCCNCHRIWRTLTWNTVSAQTRTEGLQMLHQSADLAYTYMKHWLSWRKYHCCLCKCCTRQRIRYASLWNTVLAAVPT